MACKWQADEDAEMFYTTCNYTHDFTWGDPGGLDGGPLWNHCPYCGDELEIEEDPDGKA